MEVGVRHRINPNQNVSAALSDNTADASADEVKKDNKLEENKGIIKKDSEIGWFLALIVVILFSFVTRFWKLSEPSSVVFDEIHFGKFVSYYIRGTYFFDVHPPLGKMLLALVGYLAGFDGQFLFDTIGVEIVDKYVPIYTMRSFPAACGAITNVIVFLCLKEIGISIPGSFLGAALLIFDNALITQSRFILLDINKSLKSVKLVGLFTVATVGIAVITDLWRLMDIRRGLSLRRFGYHFFARVFCLIVLPCALYLIFFFIHFKILIYSGPGDPYMSPKFQAELKGSAVQYLSTEIPYYSNITLKNRNFQAYLHSHHNTYPQSYEDGRISSGGQIVTANFENDINNYWVIAPVNTKFNPAIPEYKLTAEEMKRGIRYVRNNDYVQFFHPPTESYLLTHDIVSPLTSTHMEITTVSQNKPATGYNATLWMIDAKDLEPGQKIISLRTHFRLVNFIYGVAIHCHRGLLLPSWGLGQLEVNGNKNLNEEDNIWYFDEIIHEQVVRGKSHEIRNSDDEIETEEKDKKVVIKLTFLQKFYELQRIMIIYNAGITTTHPYSSSPFSWPFVLRGISFWEDADGLRQIYLLGNPVGWWISITGCLGRGVDFVESFHVRLWFSRGVGFLVLAWLMHYVPFFIMGRVLFVHHYLPSYIFSAMVTAAVIDSVGRGIQSVISLRQRSVGYWIIVSVLIVVNVGSFLYFSPLTYGTGFASKEEILSRKWLQSWDLQYI
ncbi:hypothetical protein HK096_003889 [Nowakowskiella sp. JEL0078]|nr:hypothetical protein HK096_003889 [Nowakowskiella sp. JEL0078]